MVLDEFLYKTSNCINDYSNIHTLERRTIDMANRFRHLKMDKLFVYFDMRYDG